MLPEFQFLKFKDKWCPLKTLLTKESLRDYFALYLKNDKDYKDKRVNFKHFRRTTSIFSFFISIVTT